MVQRGGMSVMAMTMAVVVVWGYVMALVSAHGYVSDLVIDGKAWTGYSPYYDRGDETHPPPDRIAFSLDGNGPIYDPTDANITCNYNPVPGPPKLIAPARAGSEITLTWTPWPTNHMGSTFTYLAHCGALGCRSPTLNVHELLWFKIHQDGLRPDGTWYTDDFIANNSTLTIRLPKSIRDGEYIVRHEQLSLHAVLDPEYGPEFYPSCFLIGVTGGGGRLPREGEGTTKFPGAYGMWDEGVRFDPYNVTKGDVYPYPGPPLFVDDD